MERYEGRRMKKGKEIERNRRNFHRLNQADSSLDGDEDVMRCKEKRCEGKILLSLSFSSFVLSLIFL